MTSGAQRAPWRVLVVDDNTSLNWSLVTSLRRDGYHADGAATGEAALQYLTQARYDCVISDVKMPGMDGFELLQWLRAHQPQARVIMVTAFGSPSARQEAMRGGVIAYLEKPFDLAVLKAELRRLANESGTGSAPAASEGYDLLEVARVINLSRRDIALGVQSGGYCGTLRFQRGELVWAEAGSLRGETAFLALCGPRTAQVQQVIWDGQTERNVTAPVSRLLYSALAVREGRSIGVSGALSLDQQPPDAPAAAPAAEAPAGAALQPATPTDGASASAADETAERGAPTTASTRPELAATEGSGVPTPAPASAPMPAPGRVAVASMTAPLPPMVPSSGPLPAAQVPPIDESTREAVRQLARALPNPCGVVLVRADGVIAFQSWAGMREVSAGAFSHLVAAAQAASRALLLASLGTLEDLRIRTDDHALLARRVTHAEGPYFLVAVLPAGSDLDAASSALVLSGGNDMAVRD